MIVDGAYYRDGKRKNSGPMEVVRQGAASGFAGARRRLESRPELLKDGPPAALWAIVDTIVDDYAPVVKGLDRDVEEVEATVFSGATAPTERTYLLRQEATEFYRAVHPLLAPLDALERGTDLNVSLSSRGCSATSTIT